MTASAAALLLAGCGSSSHTNANVKVSRAHKKAATAHAKRKPNRPLIAKGTLPLPEGRSGVAASSFDNKLIVSGGLSSAGVSTDTVFEITPATGNATTAGTLPTAVHDAASASLGARLLLFGGGVSEGSDRIIQVRPGPPRVLASKLPQPLSDLTATTIGSNAYIAGGWNGSATNRDIYAITPGGEVSTAGTIPVGVRYPAAGALNGRLIIAGGETVSGAPTAAAYAFDPSTGRTTSLPTLPAPTDHTSGIGFDGTFYILGGLRNGSFTDRILAWSPGDTSWHDAGRLPDALADAAATKLNGEIALVGGRDVSGKPSKAIVLKPR